LARANGELVAGYGRWLAAKELGLREVPTIRLEHLTEAQVRAFTIADNRLTEIATWNEKLLAEQLKELSELELDFSLEATGFTMGEIDLRIEGMGEPEEGNADPADAPPELSPGPPVTRAGDLWLLDRHRVYCGNALDRAAYRALMQGEKASMVFTDPPYNVPIAGHASGLGRTRHGDFVMACGEMTEAQFTDFLTEACILLARHSAVGSLHFVCMDWRHIDEILAAGREAYDELKNLCVWVKSNAGMGSLYRSQHELIFVFKHGKAAHRNNVQLGQYGRHRSNVWHYPNISAFGRGGEEGNLLALHPTVKPVALVADAMLDASARGEVVVDAFLGAGTTLIAAERTGRRCFGLELDPLYVDVTVRRWQAYTGDKARHATSGRLFDDMAAEMEKGHGR
jgi:DNA modification methylase